MGVQLNIKDEETVRAIREYAAETGRTVTATVRTAVENDRRSRAAAREERLKGAYEILKGVRELWHPDTENMTSKELMDAIYDDNEPDGFAR